MPCAWAKRRCGRRQKRLRATSAGSLQRSMALCAEQQIGSRRISMSKLVIIAADHVEIAPLVRGWKHSRTTAQRHVVDIFESEDAIVAIAGMGPVPARIAADIGYKHCNSDIRGFLSVGFAG